MSQTTNSHKLTLEQAVESSPSELPIIELECTTNTDMNVERRKEDAKKPLYIKRI